MGRPQTFEQPVAAVSVDGRGIAWSDGVFTGDPDLVRYARLAARTHRPVRVGASLITAAADDEAGAVAAMFAFHPGRAYVTVCSPTVADLIRGDSETLDDVRQAAGVPGR